MAGGSERGRELFEQRAWAEAFTELARADGVARLTAAGDLDRLAIAAHLSGRSDEAVRAWERAHQAWLAAEELPRSARSAFWLAFALVNRGELARGGGWVQRARRILDRAGLDCVEQGYLAYCAALRSAMEGELVGGIAGFGEAARLGDRFGSSELTALARVGLGRCLIHTGDSGSGLAMLDEAMAMVGTEDVGPTAVGDLYCTAIEGCQEVFDVRRAQEWTEALHRWCTAQPELVLYRGQCLVHRAELMLLGGLWSEALREVERACERLSQPRSQPALGSAFYVRGELHRLQGRLAEAEAAYGQASSYGHEPQPGLAQLWLARAEVPTPSRPSDGGWRRPDRREYRGRGCSVRSSRSRWPWATYPAARSAADELASIASTWSSPYVDAVAAYATGTVLLAEGEPGPALRSLRRAHTGWVELDAPHGAAHARRLVGLACRALGDERSAEQELASARAELARLGAATGPSVHDAVGPDAQVGGLTSREVEVLAELATGKSNRDIAAALFISEKTVATHASSILRKLQVSSRGAANAYAHEHGLVH